MGKSLLQMYALTVCFTTLMCAIVSIGMGTYDVVRIAVPAFTINENMVWQNDEQFLMYYPDKKVLPENKRAELREKYRRTALENERRSAMQRLVFLAIVVGIDLVVYAIHLRIATRLSESMSAPAT